MAAAAGARLPALGPRIGGDGAAARRLLQQPRRPLLAAARLHTHHSATLRGASRPRQRARRAARDKKCRRLRPRYGSMVEGFRVLGHVGRCPTRHVLTACSAARNDRPRGECDDVGRCARVGEARARTSTGSRRRLKLQRREISPDIIGANVGRAHLRARAERVCATHAGDESRSNAFGASMSGTWTARRQRGLRCACVGCALWWCHRD